MDTTVCVKTAVETSFFWRRISGVHLQSDLRTEREWLNQSHLIDRRLHLIYLQMETVVIVCVCVCMRARARACVCVYVYVRARARACVCLLTSLRIEWHVKALCSILIKI